MKATARANANIALVKYWGKRDLALNLPAAGSLSLTLAGLSSTTTGSLATEAGIEPVGGAGKGASVGDPIFETNLDQISLDGQSADGPTRQRVARVLDLVRRRAGLTPVTRARVDSRNDFPTGAGLASSAAGLAALAVAAARAAGLELSPAELSVLARRGSGSACRSLFGGFVEWRAGVAADGSDSHGLPLFPPEHWDLRVVVAVISGSPKEVGSSAGMVASAASSPYQAAFVGSVDGDLDEARLAVAGRDLERLARVAERSCLRMHAAMLAADPPLIYLRPESWQVIARVRELRRGGAPLFFTADAGPNVKIFCEPGVVSLARQALADLGSSVQRIIEARPGSGAEIVE
jgi:diphosphomevalonate decarboxylase